MEQSTQAQNAILQAAQATQTPRKRSRRPWSPGPSPSAWWPLAQAGY